MQRINRQGGFAIFELVFVIMVATLIGVWGASAWMRQIDDATAQATGVWLLNVKKAVDQMLKRESDVLTGIVDARPGEFRYRDTWHPTIGELIQAGHLPKGFTLKPPLGFEIGIRVLTPQGDCHEQGCKIEAWVFAQPSNTQPEVASDLTRLGKILMAMEGSGASVHPFVPDRIKGAQLDVSNPPWPEMPKLPVGSVVALSFYDSTLQTRYVRQNDKRHTHLESSLTVREKLVAQGQIQSGSLDVKGRLTAGEYLQLQGQATEQSPCEPDGLVARGQDGELLVCSNGRWGMSGGRFGGAYIWHGMYGCMTSGSEVPMINPLTGWCNCPKGYQAMQISSWQRNLDEYDRVRTFICLR